MRSKDFPEPFFNRAGLLAPSEEFFNFLPVIEKLFGDPQIFHVQTSHGYRSIREGLLKNGYNLSDKILVMVKEEDQDTLVSDVACDVVRGVHGIAEWSATYLDSFYGERSLLRPVKRSLQHASREGRATLMMARIKDNPAGVLAAYDQKVLGVYCVGTVPKFRRRGVATALLKRACQIGRARKETVVLQTLSSDSVEKFYQSRGFRISYAKEVLLKRVSDGSHA